jgi:GTP-binding protein YchF
MKIGLIGLPRSGKTTVFNALSNAGIQVTGYAAGKNEPNVAIVNVGDPRVTRLSELYKPKKTIYTTLELVDFAGVGTGFSKEGADSAFMRLVRTMDALALVARNFPSETSAPPAPLADVRPIEEELLLSDLIVADNRVQKLEQSAKKGVKTPDSQREEKVLHKVHEQLSANKPVRELELSPEEHKTLRGFQFLTAKPLIAILNSDDSRFAKSASVVAELSAGRTVVEFAGTFEMELAGMAPEEAKAFMDDMGITESARDRLTQAAYRMLGLLSFFTVGEDEVRAWTVRQGSNAVEAAGAIHTDLARGFIRAECFSYDDLVACGSEKAIKEKGLLRLEGKDYLVKDGDVLNIRFNV